MASALVSGMRRNLFGAALVAALLLTVAATYAADSTPQASDVTKQLLDAGVRVTGFRATEVGGIVILRGDSDDATNAEGAASVARNLGYARVANLIRVVGAPNDAEIERQAERKLATRTLDGCTFHVDSEHGVLTVDGKVQYELQKDLAMSILRNLNGVREVRASIQR